MSGMTELAMMFKDRDHKDWKGIHTGNVLNGFPDIEIRSDEFTILRKDRLLFASHLMQGYKRTYNMNGSMGTIEYTDTIKAGDTVILIPTWDEQKYYVIDKVVTV